MKRVRLETVASGPLEIPTMIGTTVPRAYTRTEIDRVERLVGGLKLLRVPRDDSMDFVAWRAIALYSSLGCPGMTISTSTVAAL